MNESVTVLAHNTRDALGHPRNQNELLGFVKWIDSDVVFLSEAFAVRELETAVGALGKLKDMGYRVRWALYHDPDDRKDQHGLVGLVKTGQGFIEARPGVRSFFRAAVPLGNTTLNVFGLHGDDRSGAMRLRQANAVGSVQGPTVGIGDFNNMWAHSRPARYLLPLRPAAELLPARDPTGTRENPLSLQRIGSLARRLTGMADGTMLEAFRALGLQEADPSLRPTKGFVQLDHALVSPDLTIDSFIVHDFEARSDHRPISLVVRCGE